MRHFHASMEGQDPSNHSESRQKGVQPVDEILSSAGINNHDLVEISNEHLTHKMVQKARKGRQLTRNVQNKVLNALNAIRQQQDCEPLRLDDLFNYKG